MGLIYKCSICICCFRTQHSECGGAWSEERDRCGGVRKAPRSCYFEQIKPYFIISFQWHFVPLARSSVLQPSSQTNSQTDRQTDRVWDVGEDCSEFFFWRNLCTHMSRDGESDNEQVTQYSVMVWHIESAGEEEKSLESWINTTRPQKLLKIKLEFRISSSRGWWVGGDVFVPLLILMIFLRFRSIRFRGLL